MILKMNNIICELIQSVFWHTSVKDHSPEEWADVLKEVKEHKIELLFMDALSSWNVPEDIFNTWKKDSFSITSHNVQLLSLQKELHELLIKERIEYSILKGSAASVYYPRPLYRTAGDIDLIVRDEDFERTHALFDRIFGASSIGSKHNGKIREYVYAKDLCVIELHQSYAILANNKDRILDSWIKEDIHNNCLRIIGEKYPFCMPSEHINGLVLLAHIAQHLEGGLGLRQIIDWMIYVYTCLPDNKWPAFQEKAREIGLNNLAVTTTRMCQIYLGLPTENIHWAENADSDLCIELMEFVLGCGDFGRKQAANNTVSMIVSRNQGIFTLFRNLQHRGLSNWNALRKYPFLRPLAWIYQGCRYIRRGMGRKNALGELKKELSDGKKRDRLLKELGIKSTWKGTEIK